MSHSRDIMESGNFEEVVSMFGLAEFFKEARNCIRDGEIRYKSGFVLDVRKSEFSVFGVVRASMRDESHAVELVVDGQGNITSGKCDCVAGKFKCSHMAATAIYCNREGASKTDLPNSWLRRPKTAFSEVGLKEISQIFPASKSYSSISRAVTPNDKHHLFEMLQTVGSHCPMKWIVSPETTQTDFTNVDEPRYIEPLLPLYMEDKTVFVNECKVTTKQIKWLSEKTKLQRHCPLWGRYRQLRLTSSNFGQILDCYNRHKNSNIPYPKSLFKALKGEYNLSTQAVLWGQAHEEIAIERYAQVTNNFIEKIGLVLFPCGFLGSSPDRIILAKNASQDRGVLEIKCPWKHRSKTISDMMKEELQGSYEKKSFYLTSDGSLSTAHKYWHQVQAQMLATNTRFAHFVVWTTTDIKIVHVIKDDGWARVNVPKLTDFYLDVFLKKITEM